jgi:ATP-dependent DNA helicase DinG
MGNKFVVIDLETTGNAPKKGDKIIQFAAVVVENGRITEEFSSLINPGQTISPFIEELTGLTDEMVKDAPVFSEIAPKVVSLLDDAYFVAHNVLFDLSFLQEELSQAGFPNFYGPILDTVEMARVLLPTADSYQLSELAAQEGFNHERPHQADSDAYVTAELLLLMMERLYQLPQNTVRQLQRLSGGLKSDLDLLIDQVISEKESSIETLAEDLEIHRGITLRKYQAKEGQAPQDDNQEIAYPAEKADKIELLKKAFPDFELRSGQFQMMDSVFCAFNEGNHTMIEAGTGVGKSLAYLIPAAFYGKQINKPIIISTYTTQLQEQLLNKDIPLLKNMLSFPVHAVLLKGRSHYLSLAKFEQALKEIEDNYDIILTKMQILVWLTETSTGDVDELNLSSGGRTFWNKIKNDETVFFQKKTWLAKDFYLRARKAAEKSEIIITNHSFLMSDLTAEQAILPSYSHVVIDEGHHFVKAAGKYFGLSLDYLNTRILLNQIGNYDQKQLLYKLEQLLEKANLNERRLAHSFEISQLMQNLTFEMDEFFKVIGIFAKRKAKSRKNDHRISTRFSFNDSSREWQALKTEAERFLFLIKDLIAILQDRLEITSNGQVSLSAKEKSLLDELTSAIGRLEKLTKAIRGIFLFPDEGYVAWIEMDMRSAQNATTVYFQPVSIGSFLQDRFFREKKSAVITSATLSVKNSFDYMMSEMGLTPFDCTVEQIPSPFDYTEQVKLMVPDDLPEVNAVPLEEYVAAISEHIISIAEATKGRMLILFTSHEMLRKTHELIKESGFLDDFAIIAQGISSGSRSRLTRNFQRFDKAILLGTNSFWEGIDIPGEDLTCLIIVRLPFSPPDEPMTEAKCELIKEKGGNPFADYCLPEAVIRFKQGFGRLIRTTKDRGFIFVFDRRIITTSYGKAFLNSIPPIPVEKGDLGEQISKIHSWI